MVLWAEEHGAGQPLILLPWFGLDHAVMAAACEPALAGTAWRRIYLDLPGTGKSAPVAPNTDAVADAVERAVSELAGPGPVAVVGCSYGGYLAAELARRDPARFAAILLICSGVRITPADRDLSGVRAADPEPGWLDSVPEQLSSHFERAVGCQSAEVGARMGAAFAANAETDGSYLRELQATGYPLSTEDALSSIRAWVTVISGGSDQICGYRDQFALVSAINAAAGGEGAERPARARAADYVCLGDIGHYLPFEQPARFKTLLLDWLVRVQPAP